MSEIQERIVKIIAEQFDKQVSEIKLEDRFLEDLSADSLDIVELSMTIKGELGIRVQDDITNFHTVGDVVAFVEKKAACSSK